MMEPIRGSTATVCKSPALLLEQVLLLSTALNGPLGPRAMAGETFSQVESMKSPSMGLHLHIRSGLRLPCAPALQYRDPRCEFLPRKAIELYSHQQVRAPAPEPRWI